MSAEWLSEAETQESATVIRMEADEARSRQKNPKASRSDWSRLNTSDLSAAMAEVCKTPDSELNESLRLCQQYAEIAKETGNDMAHPNPFVALVVLDLLDPDTDNIRRTTEYKNRLLSPTCLLMLFVQILILHAAAISKHDPKCISLRRILGTIGRAWLRAKRDNDS